MQKISTILIDMYGVILEESKGKFIPYTFEHFNAIEHERLKRQFKEEQLFTRAGLGEFTSDEFLARLGYEDTQYHMKDYIENYLTLDKGFVPFAEKYYKRYELVLLSNDVSQWSTYITQYHQLNKFFSDKIVSGDVRCRKPEKRIYEMTLERIGKTPEECLFIDNSVKNLEVAAELGIHTVLFNRDGEAYDGEIVENFGELVEMMEKQNMEIIIRKAQPSDAREMGSCHYHCWQETYRGLIADSYLDALDEQKNMDRFEEMYQLTGEYQFVLEYNDKIIGLFDISKARDGYAPIEVQGLYLRKAYHGQGFGGKIMAFIRSKCNNSNFYLWCLRNNPTCGYYEHMGGRVVDKRMISIGGREVEEVCYLF